MCKDVNHFQTAADTTGLSSVFMHWVYNLTAYHSHNKDDRKSVEQVSLVEAEISV